MIDYETEIQVRGCKECKHYLHGCKCKAFDVIPIDYFLDAGKHTEPHPKQRGMYVFEPKTTAQTVRIYKAQIT